MKRHHTLQPLSRDHREGLLLAVRLMQRESAMPKLWSHDPAWQADFVLRFFNDHLVPHSKIEEEILFPAARQFLGEQTDMIDRLIGEHRQLLAIVERLHHPDPSELGELLVVFRRILETHIRREERQLFPLCEKRLPAGYREAVGKDIAAMRGGGN